ncbi:MAG TPA: hypothetical protein VFG86_01005 [Chloroflexota bacterium]|nr:hypothetical protein [Chloroflexota bacterium]
MQLQLTAEEHELLRDLINRELGNIKAEVYRTDSADYKRMLKVREAAIISIMNKLQGEPALDAR